MPYRKLCNDLQREGIKPSSAQAFGLFCYVPLHKIWYGMEEDLLVHFGLVQNSHPTYAALLCLGLNPLQWVSGAITRCVDWRGNDRHSGWLESLIHRGSLLMQFQSSRDFLRKSLRLSRVIDKEVSTEEWEIPFRVLDEALANALVHREYANQTNFVHRTDFVQVEVFVDRVEISSPGEPPPPMTMALLEVEHTSHPRNPLIAGIFYLYNYIEEVGSGIQRMQRLMKEADLQAPEFKLSEDRTFKVVLYRPEQRLYRPTASVLTAREVEVLRLLAIGLTNKEIAERLILSPHTVNVHIHSIYRKIVVNSRSAATRFAIEYHLI